MDYVQNTDSIFVTGLSENILYHNKKKAIGKQTIIAEADGEMPSGF